MFIAGVYSVIYDLVLLPVDYVILLVAASNWLLLVPSAVGSVRVAGFKVAIALLSRAVLVVRLLGAVGFYSHLLAIWVAVFNLGSQIATA